MPLRLKFYRKGIFQCIPFKKYIFSGLRTKNKRGEGKVFVSFDGLSIWKEWNGSFLRSRNLKLMMLECAWNIGL